MGCMNEKSSQIQKNKEKYVVKTFQQEFIAEIVIKSSVVINQQRTTRIEEIKVQVQIPSQDLQIVEQKKKNQAIVEFNMVKFFKLYQECLEEYNQHKIDKAGQICSEILSMDFSQAQRQKLDKELSQCQRIKSEHENMISIAKEIYSRQWELKSTKNNVRISTRREQNIVEALIQSQIEVPFQVFLSVFTQIDLYQNYMPFMIKSNTERIVSRNCKIGFSAVKFPFLTVRESFFRGIAYDRLEFNGSIFMYTTSIENNHKLQQQLNYIPNINPDAVQLIYKYVALKYEPIQKNRGKVTLAINSDMKISLIPLFLMQIVTITFGNDLFGKILEISKNFKDSPWQEKVKINPHLFNFFKDILNQYLKKSQYRLKQIQ